MRRPGYQGDPGDGDGLLERAEQLALLNEVLTAVADSRHGQIVLAVGEAGIGKTALLRRFSDSVTGSARTLWAACDHLFVPRPLGPFLDLSEAAGGQLATRIEDAARPYDVAAAPSRAARASTASRTVCGIRPGPAASTSVTKNG